MSDEKSWWKFKIKGESTVGQPPDDLMTNISLRRGQTGSRLWRSRLWRHWEPKKRAGYSFYLYHFKSWPWAKNTYCHTRLIALTARRVVIRNSYNRHALKLLSKEFLYSFTSFHSLNLVIYISLKIFRLSFKNPMSYALIKEAISLTNVSILLNIVTNLTNFL